MKEKNKNVILLNNLYNGRYVEDKVGGEIINMYQSDNGNHYIYINPYGNINNKWDNQIKHVLFIRSIGNGVVKVIGKAEIKKQISCNAIRKINAGIDDEQKQYIDKNNITYGNVKLYELGSWSNYFITFEAKEVYKAKKDIHLTVKDPEDFTLDNIFKLEDIKRINNQSQKLYVEPNSKNHELLTKIINNPNYWEEEKVKKIDVNKRVISKSFLSIIKKENDEFVNSNLLAYYLKEDKKFWSDFVEEVLKISDENIINGKPIITRERIGNIDIFIKIKEHAIIIIENKIKSGINGKKKNGYSQLEKYVKVVNEQIKNSNCTQHFFILRPDYNNENYTKYNDGNKYKEIKYSEIHKILKNREDIDIYFKEFIKVVKNHSAKYESRIFEIMDERFIKQIINKQKNQ